jgi:hypothetical protein
MPEVESQQARGPLSPEEVAERLSALKGDMTKGQARLRELDEERAALRDQLLRIDGAIRILAELDQRETENGSSPELRQRA